MNVSSRTVEEEEQIEKWYLNSFELFEEMDGKRANGQLDQLRTDALEQFRASGFPTSALEEWKYTSTESIRNNPFRILTDSSRASSITESDISEARIPDLDAHRIVFVDGFYADHLTNTDGLPEGVKLMDLSEALSRPDSVVYNYLGTVVDGKEYPFAALNTAFLQHGAFLHVPDNEIVDKPIHVIHLTSSETDYGAVFPRNLVCVGENSEVSVIEHYTDTTDAIYFSNSVTELHADRNAFVDHYKLQLTNERSLQVSTIESRQKADSKVNQTNIHFGSKLTRNDINATIDGEGAESALNGLFCTDDNQHVDNHTRLYHMQPNCNSYELYTGVLDDESTGVFNGTIYVHKRAQGTSSNQHNNNLLLTNEATINTKPELEIFADDVTCSHGATIGQLQERAKYYLRTRGIDEEHAEDMLINAFAKELTNRIKLEPLRQMVDRTFYSRRNSRTSSRKT